MDQELPMLENYIKNNILVDDNEYYKEIEKVKLEEGVEIRNKEHLYYYKIYRKFFKPPIDESSRFDNNSIRKCIYCNSLFKWKGNFCKICGGFPVYQYLKENRIFAIMILNIIKY